MLIYKEINMVWVWVQVSVIQQLFMLPWPVTSQWNGEMYGSNVKVISEVGQTNQPCFSIKSGAEKAVMLRDASHTNGWFLWKMALF